MPSLRLPAALLAVSLTANASLSAAVVTVGDNDPVFDNGAADGWDAVFIFNTALTEPNAAETFGQVTQFEFWADAGTTNRNITPLLFSSADGGLTHQTIGIGTTYTIGSGGTFENSANTLEFGLTSGTDTFDTTTPGTTYFVGYHTTDRNGIASATGGVVPFASTGGGPNVLWQTETVPAVGQNPSVGSSATFSSNRSYAYNFDLEFVDPATLDTDGDGLRDNFEQRIIDADPGDAIDSLADVLPGDDFDNDSSTNKQEQDRGTDPTDDDTDDDTLLDGHETGTGVYVSPTDTGTNPLSPDTDGDGLADNLENNSGIFNSTADPGTDPNNPDTDGDGLLDSVENNDGVVTSPTMTGTDPHNPDTDDDSTSDGDEIARGTDPHDPNSGANDGLIAGQQMVALDQMVADGWAVCYIDEERPFKLRGGTSNAIQFNFFAAPSSIGLGGRLTPFLVEPLGPNTFIVRAIGTTRLEGTDWNAAGLQSFAFSDDGAPVVEDGWMAGFITSDPDGSNPSNQIVPYRVDAGIDGWETGGAGPTDPGGVTVGAPPEMGPSGTDLNGFGMRDYSFQIVAGRPDVIVITDVNHDPDADTTELTWTSSEGELFEVRKSLDLTGDPNVWPLVMAATPAAAAPAATTTQVVDSAATEDAAFYKVFKIPPPPLFEEDFESGAPGWTTLDNGVAGATRWELGTPSLVGPFEAHSPVTCYGTDLDANYSDGLDNGGLGIALRSPLIDLRGAPSATLTFWHFIDVGGVDEGTFHFLDAGGALLDTPVESPFFAFTGLWDRVSIALPAAVLNNGEVILEWQLHSETDAQLNFSGWHIDDVLLEP